MRFARLFLAFSVALSGCGTRDYKDKNAEKNAEAQPQGSPDNTKKVAGGGGGTKGVPSLFQHTAREGTFWKWSAGVPWAERMKCELRDGSNVDYLQTLWFQALGGIVLGVIYKSSGAYYLGRPQEPGPDRDRAIPVGEPKEPDWAWSRVGLTGANVRAGVVQGGLVATGCAHLLGPGVFFLTDGFFGRDFNAFATSLTLGILTAGATYPWAGYFARGGFGEPVNDPRLNSSAFKHYVRALSRNFGGGRQNFTRHTILPGLFAVSLGGGIGLLVYDRLQNPDPNAPAPTALENELRNPSAHGGPKMILALVFFFSTAQAKEDRSQPSKWERVEIEQAKLMLDQGLPAPICSDNHWSEGLRRVIFGLHQQYPDKKFDVSNMTIAPPETSKTEGLVGTLCALVTMREEKCGEKPPEKP